MNEPCRVQSHWSPVGRLGDCILDQREYCSWWSTRRSLVQSDHSSFIGLGRTTTSYKLLEGHNRTSHEGALFRRNERFRQIVLAKENSKKKEGHHHQTRDLQLTLPDPTGPMTQIRSPGWASKIIFFNMNVSFYPTKSRHLKNEGFVVCRPYFVPVGLFQITHQLIGFLIFVWLRL